jgi:(p)ppGpp synthase/HD superfamily hydrolase
MFATQKQLEATAELLARMAHSDQVDQATDRYIEHLSRVVARITASEHLDRAAAWPYDVVEGTSVTLDHLRTVVSPTVVSAVDALTRRESESRADYYQGVIFSPTALRVMAAVIDDNTDPALLSHIDLETRSWLAATYESAREILGPAACRLLEGQVAVMDG